MELEVLPPSMQDSRDSGHSTEIFPIRAQLQYRFGGCLEKQSIHSTLLVAKRRIQLSRNGENNMEIRCIKQVFLLLVNPLFFREGLAFGAVPIPAGVVRDPRMAAVVAGIHMCAQGGGSAVNDVSHSLPLGMAHLVALSISADVLRKNILNFNAHCCAAGRRGLQGLPRCSPNAGIP